MKRHYDYFDVSEVDWDAARTKHRGRAIASADHVEFLQELARLFCPLRDPHLTLRPPFGALGKHAVPDLVTVRAENRLFVGRWPSGYVPSAPHAFRDVENTFPEIVSINGAGVCESLLPVLLLGAHETTVPIVVEWPNGSRTTEALPIPPRGPRTILDEGDLTRIDYNIQNGLGYVAIRSFSLPRRSSVGSDFTSRVRDQIAKIDEAFDAVKGTSRLIVDLRGNTGGYGQLATEVLGHFVDKRISLAVRGDSYGYAPIAVPRERRYRGTVVVLVNESTASAGEITAAFLRRFAGAHIVGSSTSGAEAPLSSIEGLEGSLLTVGFGSFDPEKKPTFQRRGVQPDTVLELSVERMRKDGIPKAWIDIERERFNKALEILGIEDPGTALVAATQGKLEATLESRVRSALASREVVEEMWTAFLEAATADLAGRPVSCPTFVLENKREDQLAACMTIEMPFKDFKKAWERFGDRHADFRVEPVGDWRKDGSLWHKRLYILRGARLMIWFSEPNRGVVLVFS